MNTVPWYQTPATPDAWHHVTAPGGYEWWYFDAEDPSTDTQVVAILLDGFVFHPEYLRRYARYRRRPTRYAPPVAGEYPCAYFVVYRGGRILAQFMTQYGAGDFAASSERVDVRVGPNRLTADGAGALTLALSGTPWALTARGPKLQAGVELSGRFTFRPRFAHPPQERPFFSRELSGGAEHRWVVANPLCDVDGEFTVGGERVAFNGRGYHDHNYGTGPIGPGLRRWIWGRVLLEDAVSTFHFARPRDRRLPDEVHLLHADAEGVRELAARAEGAWDARTAVGLGYPRELRLGPHLRLSSPRVVDSSPFYLRLTYDADVSGRTGRAFCEVAYPHRLRWPVLGRMIELSIERRDRRASPAV
jgi:carotenoid 1,2-hydratase